MNNLQELYRHLEVPGTVINHHRSGSKLYIGSPSFVVLDDGQYIVSHDVFGPKSSEWVQGQTNIYKSSDRGKSWELISIIKGAFWNNLFVHNNALFLIGPDRHFGTVLIRKSLDAGYTWSEPTNEEDGLLLKGEFHTAPVPMVVHNGRIWRAMETAHGPIREWGKRLGAMVMSAPVEADLLRADSWVCSTPLHYDSTYLEGHFNGWLEGNVVVSPEGQIWNLLRVDDKSTLVEKAAVVKVSPDGTIASFDPQTGFIALPGGSKKFTIRYDTVSKRYWSLLNIIPERLMNSYQGQNSSLIRNTLALASSGDLLNWELHREVLHHADASHFGFQYADWQFEGDDIVFVSRTAYTDQDGDPIRAHSSNYLTFHRITGFRN